MFCYQCIPYGLTTAMKIISHQIINNKATHFSFIVTYLLLFILLFSCKEDDICKEDIDPNEYSRNLLMSSGWLLDKCIFTLDDYSEIEVDSLSAFYLSSDTAYTDFKNTLIEEWMVFLKDTVRFNGRYISYSCEKGEVEWTKYRTDHIEFLAKWGFYHDGSLYSADDKGPNYKPPWPLWPQ